MVLRMTGAGWLASLMRPDPEGTDRAPIDPGWPLVGEPETTPEAPERLPANDAR